MRPLGAPRSELRDVAALLEPRSVALVGASERTGRIIEAVFSSPATGYAVSTTREEVLGHRCFRSLAELPEVPDVAVLLVGHRRVAEAAARAVEAGVRALVVPGVGAEAGREAGGVLGELAEVASRSGTAMLGPNCMGMARPDGASVWIGALPESFAAGAVSVVAQSGSVAEGLVALGGRVGFRFVVSSGGELTRDAADFVRHFAEDPGTRAVGLFLEAVRRPAALSAALVACARAGKPVACLKVGRSRAAGQIALAHTGALVGSPEACSAFLKAHGVIEVEDLPDLVEVLEVLGRRHRPCGTRLGAVSESGGETELLADCAEAAGLALPELPRELAAQLEDEFPNFAPAQNPLDAWAVDEPEKVFPRSLELLAGSGCFDVLLGQVDLTQYRSVGDNDWCFGIVRGLAKAARGRRLFPAIVSSEVNDPPGHIAAFARENDIALLRGARSAMRALAAAATWAPVEPAPCPPSSGVEIDDLLRPGAMAEHESSTVLERYGVAFARRRRATSPAEAGEAASAIGFPVVVKTDGPAHKEAAGGVVLGLRTAAEVEAAARRLGGPVLVAEEARRGLEVICGMHRDAAFGPVLVVGLGGRAAEAMGHVSRALGPLDEERALDLLDSVPGLAASVTKPARRQLAAALVAISSLACEHEEIVSVDVNPLVVNGDEVLAVDGLIVVGGAP